MTLDEAWRRFLSELSEYEAWDHDFIGNPHSPDRMMKKLVDEHGASAAPLLTEQLDNPEKEVAFWASVGLGYIGPGAGKNAATRLARLSTRVAAETLYEVDPELWWKEQHPEIEPVLEEQVRAGVDQSVAFMERSARDASDEVLAALLRNHVLRDAWTADPRADVVAFLRAQSGRSAAVRRAAAELLTVMNSGDAVSALVDALCLDNKKVSLVVIERVASHPASIGLVDHLIRTNALGGLATLLERRRCAGLATPGRAVREYIRKKLEFPDRTYLSEQHDVADAANAAAALGDDLLVYDLACAVNRENSGYAWRPLVRALRVFGKKAINELQYQDWDYAPTMLAEIRAKPKVDPLVVADNTFLEGWIEPTIHGAFRAYADVLLYTPSAHAAFQLAWIDRAFGSEIVPERVAWIRGLGFHDEEFLRELATPVPRPLEGDRSRWDGGQFQQNEPEKADRARGAGLPSLAARLRSDGDPAWLEVAMAHLERVERAVAV